MKKKLSLLALCLSSLFAATDSFAQIDEYHSIIEWQFSNGILIIFPGDGITGIMPPYKTQEYLEATGKLLPDWHEYTDEIMEIVIRDGVLNVGNSSFSTCKNLRKVTIPESCLSIGDYAFASCESLTEIRIPDKVTAIGSFAFQGCAQLRSVKLPRKLEYIGEQAFYSCYRSLTYIEIPPLVKHIGRYAFSMCTSLEKVNLLTLVPVTIDETVFHQSPIKNATLIVLNGMEGYYRTAVGWKDFKWIGEEFELDNDEIITYRGSQSDIVVHRKINETDIRTIGARAFQNNTDIVSIAISDGIKSIGAEAFKACDRLETFLFYYGDAYPDETALRSGAASEELTVGERAWEDCVSLKSVVFPHTVARIGDRALKGCTALETISVHREIPLTISDNVFEGLNNKPAIRLLVPQGSGERYANAPVWKDFNIQESDFTGIKAPAYHVCHLSVDGGLLQIDGETAETIRIYSLLGTLLQELDKPAGKAVFSIENIWDKVLIVKSNNGWVEKTVLKKRR